MVEVVRSKPTDRDDVSLTLYTLELEAEVYSNYLYVGKFVRYDRNIMNSVYKLKRKYNGDVDKIINELSNSISPVDYLPSQNGVNYVIPGSTVKGTVRANLELSFKPVNGRVYACLSVTDEDNVPSSRFIKIANELGIIFDRSPCTNANNVCLICDLFGTMGLSSRVFFTDFVAENPKLESCDVQGLTYRVFTKNSRFVGRLYMWARNLAEVGLVLVGMGILGNESVPVLMGSWKYACKDFGLVKFRVRDAGFNVNEAVSMALQEYGKLGLAVDVIKGFYEAKVGNGSLSTDACCRVVK